MAWRIELTETAEKLLAKLDRQVQKDILRYLRQRLATGEDPRRFGAPLRRNLAGLWKYRLGDYRMICDVQDGRMVVLVVRLGHRRDVYGA